MAEVKLSQESYDELLKDIKALRLQSDTYFEQWQDVKHKAEAWDKVVEIYQAQYEEGLTHNEVVDKIGYIIHDLERT
ncbi:MAG: hypothetical protein NRZ54_11555 [Staphylococcus haemolyticus]|nr:hypothetical protein NRZ53_08955 [Staphylococcus haemolyticus]WAI21541.1 MAG: hypothetical protein NRZ55_05875 [Staphylococcus haemolyticus]WAI22709.1 MAG: hypothetical protein NRZ54_11555 [Staphylococcus haemolyticus]